MNPSLAYVRTKRGAVLHLAERVGVLFYPACGATYLGLREEERATSFRVCHRCAKALGRVAE